MHGILGLVLLMAGFGVLELNFTLREQYKEDFGVILQIFFNVLMYAFLIAGHEAIAGRL